MPITTSQKDRRIRPSSLISRNRGYRRLPPVLLIAAFLALPASAGAAVTVGQLPGTPPDPDCPATGHDYLQPSVSGGNLYSARQAGTITSWSTNSKAAGAAFVFKVFRRTSDPDLFQVVGRAAAPPLTAGVNTFQTSLHVESGDLIGLHAQGGITGSSCTFPMPGDSVLQSQSSGDLATGESGQFVPIPDVRLNLSAVLVPSNAFTIAGISRHRRNGTATMTADLSNPGLLTIAGKGLKKKHVSTAVARRVSLNIAAAGKRKARLSRRGKLKVAVTATFFPTGGDPSSQTVTVKLVQRRPSPSV